jgi:hypothetical protein
MKAAIAVIVLMIYLMASGSSAQSISSPLSLSGYFDSNRASSYEVLNPQPALQGTTNDLWTWGGAPKGSIVINGNLVPDPYYVWKSLNYTVGWLGEVYVDLGTGNPVYAYINPYTGMQVNFYMDPKTGKPAYLNTYPYYRSPYYGNALPSYSWDYLPVDYSHPFYYMY